MKRSVRGKRDKTVSEAEGRVHRGMKRKLRRGGPALTFVEQTRLYNWCRRQGMEERKEEE
jgi:hypothetical protein